MIGIAHHILDCMLLEQKKPRLTHEVLITLMAEVAAVMNARPLIPVSSDPESPLIPAPAVLLTFKTGPTPFIVLLVKATTASIVHLATYINLTSRLFCVYECRRIYFAVASTVFLYNLPRYLP